MLCSNLHYRKGLNRNSFPTSLLSTRHAVQSHLAFWVSVQGLGFGVWDLGFGVWGVRFGFRGLRLRVYSLGFRVYSLGFRV
jgi:hypothetical protein